MRTVARIASVAAVVACCGIIEFSNDLSAAPTIKQIHPAGGAAGGQFVIAVISDHYGATSTDQNNFDADAANLILSDFINKPYYQDHQNDFTIKTIYDPWPNASSPALTTNSNYGFETTSSGNCEIASTGYTAGVLDTLAATVSADYIVVIGNYGFDTGCSKDNWTYVFKGAFGNRVLTHEFGHQTALLLDEYVRRAGIDPDPPAEGRNCSIDTTSPWWLSAGLTGVGIYGGCHLYSAGIVHPASVCLMNENVPDSDQFCGVCRHLMDLALAPRLIAAPSSPTNVRIVKAASVQRGGNAPAENAGRSVRVLLRVDRQRHTIDPIVANDVTGPAYERTRPVGDYIFEIREGGATLRVGAVTGSPFEVRSYKGGRRHDTTPTDVGTITVTIPFATKESLRSRALEIVVYKITSPTRVTDITPESFARLRQANGLRQLATLPADALKRVLANGPPRV